MSNAWDGERGTFPPAVRRAILRRDRLCVTCGVRPSTIADHEPNYVELVRAGVEDPHHIRFGQGMCAPCHDEKTRREQQRGRLRWRLQPEAHPGLLP